jgi:hypothetical protein
MKRRRLPWSALCALLLSFGCDGSPPPVVDAGRDAGVDANTPRCTFDAGPPEEIPEPEVYTPRWAFEPWISKDISDRDDSYEFVRGFLDRGIPTGVLVIDSPWDVHYTTFTPRPSRYPDFEGMVDDMHAMGIRVVMWTAQMVNTQSFDLETGGDSYEGAIVPVDVDNDVNGLGDAASAGHLTVLVWPAAEATSFRLHEEDEVVTTLTASTAGVTLSRARRPTLLRVRRDAAPSAVQVNGAALEARADRAAFDAATDGFLYDAEGRWLWVKIPAQADEVRVTTTD